MLLCTAGIFLTVPVARSIQQYVYDSVGKVPITYTILLLIIFVLFALLYYMVSILKTKSMTQYLWLFACCSAYAYFTILLKSHPEEAAHFIEYGLLTFFVFRALAYRVKDRTVYVTTVLIVTVVGIVDEFIQWMLPVRKWDYRDVGLNALSSGLFILLVWKVVRPTAIRSSVQKFSLRALSGAAVITVIAFGICLSNTPDFVALYTEQFKQLLWLQAEEVMTAKGALPVSPGKMWLIVLFLIFVILVGAKQWEKRLDS